MIETSLLTAPLFELDETINEEQARVSVTRAAIINATDERTNRLVGSLYMQINGLAGVIADVGVEEEYRSRGIARGMMKAAVQVGKALGLEYLELYVAKYNFPAIGLYSKVGFVAIDNDDYVTMRMELKNG